MEIENVTTTAQQPQQQPQPKAVDLGEVFSETARAFPCDRILRVFVMCALTRSLAPWLQFCREEVARLAPAEQKTVSFPAVPMSEDVDAKIAAMVKEAVAKQGAAKRKPLKKAPKKKAAKRKARK